MDNNPNSIPEDLRTTSSLTASLTGLDLSGAGSDEGDRDSSQGARTLDWHELTEVEEDPYSAFVNSDEFKQLSSEAAVQKMMALASESKYSKIVTFWGQWGVLISRILANKEQKMINFLRDNAGSLSTLDLALWGYNQGIISYNETAMSNMTTLFQSALADIQREVRLASESLSKAIKNAKQRELDQAERATSSAMHPVPILPFASLPARASESTAVVELEEDGSYTNDYLSFTVAQGKVQTVTALHPSWKPLMAFEGTSSLAFYEILNLDCVRMTQFLEATPDWLCEFTVEKSLLNWSQALTGLPHIPLRRYQWFRDQS